MALAHRIGRLESRARLDAVLGPCALCGHRAGAPFRVEIEGPAVVRTLDELALEPARRPAPGDRCGACGRTLVFRVPPPLPARAR